MKYLAKSQNNKMVQLGEDIKRGKWYYITPEVINDVEGLSIGDDITFVSEPRGGAFYITFLAKGTVEPPVTVVSKPVAMSTPVSTTTHANPTTKTWTKTSEMSKGDWEEKERRDFKGRSLAYASSALTLLQESSATKITEDDYLNQLFRIAKQIEEYIYSK